MVDDFLSSVDTASGETFRPKLSKRSPVGLYFKLLSAMFTRGQDASPLLKLLGDAAREAQVDFSGGEYCEFVSLCILSGHADRIDGVAPGEDVSFDEFVELAPLLGQGDLAAANDICAEVGKNEELSRLDRPACNLLALLVGAFARPSPTRAAKCIRALAPNANYRAYDRSEGERREVETRSGIFHSLSLGVTGAKSHYSLTEKQFDFLRNFGEPVWALLDGMNKKESARIAGAMLTTAERAAAKGYPTIAGAYLSVFGWALPEGEKTRAESLVKRITDAGGVWFRPFLGVDSSWQRIVAVLDERLPKAVTKKSADTGKVKSGRIIWGVSEEDEGRELVPFFRGPRGADDGRDDKKVTFKAICNGKYDDCLTDSDKAVVAALRKAKYEGLRKKIGTNGTITTHIPSEVFAAFCGQDNVVRVVPGAQSRLQAER